MVPPVVSFPATTVSFPPSTVSTDSKDFEEMSDQFDSFQAPPIYRNMRFHSQSTPASFGDSRKPRLVDVPDEFIPPHHCFKHRSKSQLGSMDIVCGRGAPTSVHYGNQVFQKWIKGFQLEYMTAPRREKPVLAMKILDTIRCSGARFVRRDKGLGIWVDIGDQKAYEKVCQALRDSAPEIRRRLRMLEATRKE